MLTSFRDPVSSMLGDFFGDYDPTLTTTANLPFRGRQDRSSIVAGRLLTLDAWETDTEFWVRCEVWLLYH